MSNPRLDQLRAEARRLLAELPLSLERIAEWDAFLAETELLVEERAAKLAEMTAEIGMTDAALDKARVLLAQLTEGLLRMQGPGGVTRH